MRASPPCQVSLRHFGVWRAALVVIALAGCGSVVAWLWSREPPVSIGLMTAVATTVLLTLVLTVSLWRVSARSLRWDGQVWWLDAVPGGMKVVIDLGPWMLLSFTPAAPGRLMSWLPVQRRGLEPQWHALRCAVYSPRPLDQP